MLEWQLVLAFAAFVLYDARAWTPDSVNLSAEVPPVLSVTVGGLAYFVVVVAPRALLQRAGLYDPDPSAELRVMARIWPRGRRDKALAAVAAGILNPFTEEFFFRGILVFHLGELFGSAFPAIGVGFIVSLSMHAYQGRAGLPTHVPMYFATILLLYSPMGLWAAIGFHFAGDLFPLASLSSEVKRYRTWRRRMRTRTHAQMPDEGLQLPDSARR